MKYEAFEIAKSQAHRPCHAVSPAHFGWLTERKKLAAEVALHEQRLNAFFTDAPAGLVLLDMHWARSMLCEGQSRSREWGVMAAGCASQVGNQ